MGLTMNEKQAATEQLALEHRRATQNMGRIVGSLA